MSETCAQRAERERKRDAEWYEQWSKKKKEEEEKERNTPFGSWETCDKKDAQRLMDKLVVIERLLKHLVEAEKEE